jgi:hypothetical protein
MKGQSEKDPVSMENSNKSNASVWSCVHHQRNRVSRIHGKAVLWIISSLSKALPTLVGLDVEGLRGLVFELSKLSRPFGNNSKI